MFEDGNAWVVFLKECKMIKLEEDKRVMNLAVNVTKKPPKQQQQKLADYAFIASS